MNEIASPGQLRLAYLRWSLLTVPAIVLLGFLSGRLANSGYGNRWFDALEKPALMPPGWLFGVAWTILYILMGLARREGAGAGDYPVPGPAAHEPCLVAALLPRASGRQRSDVDIDADRRCRDNHMAVCPDTPCRRFAASPLSGVARLCFLPQL